MYNFSRKRGRNYFFSYVPSWSGAMMSRRMKSPSRKAIALRDRVMRNKGTAYSLILINAWGRPPIIR